MRLRTALVAGAVAAALMAACAPGSDNDGDDGSTSAPDAVQTDPAEMGDITLTVWDQEVRGGQADQITTLNQAFEDKYPNITIERVSRETDQLRDTLRGALSGNDAPDVVQANNSRSDMGQYVKAGLLTPLGDYADAYGWADNFPESIRSSASYTDGGAVLGDGDLYGLPQMGELVGVFYNKSKLSELSLEPPENTEDFEAALDAAKGAGETPIQFGNSEGWPGIHEFGFVQNQFVDADAIRDLGFGRSGSSWTSPENDEAAQTMVDWANAGYFTDGYSGIAYDPAWQAFAKGNGVFFVGGTWLVADLAEAMGDDVGFVLPPAGESGQNTVTGGISIPWAVPAKSDAQDAAAAYIDFITNTEAMTTVAEAGNLPVIAADEQESSGLQAEVFDAWAMAGEDDLIVPYLDWSTATFYDTSSAGIQDLLAGKQAPAKFLEALEADYSQAAS